jgi:hypothetical protein
MICDVPIAIRLLTAMGTKSWFGLFFFVTVGVEGYKKKSAEWTSAIVSPIFQ